MDAHRCTGCRASFVELSSGQRCVECSRNVHKRDRGAVGDSVTQDTDSDKENKSRSKPDMAMSNVASPSREATLARPGEDGATRMSFRTPFAVKKTTTAVAPAAVAPAAAAAVTLDPFTNGNSFVSTLFATASGVPVVVSDAALKKARQRFSHADDCEPDGNADGYDRDVGAHRACVLPPEQLPPPSSRQIDGTAQNGKDSEDAVCGASSRRRRLRHDAQVAARPPDAESGRDDGHKNSDEGVSVVPTSPSEPVSKQRCGSTHAFHRDSNDRVGSASEKKDTACALGSASTSICAPVTRSDLGVSSRIRRGFVAPQRVESSITRPSFSAPDRAVQSSSWTVPSLLHPHATLSSSVPRVPSTRQGAVDGVAAALCFNYTALCSTHRLAGDVAGKPMAQHDAHGIHAADTVGRGESVAHTDHSCATNSVHRDCNRAQEDIRVRCQKTCHAPISIASVSNHTFFFRLGQCSAALASLFTRPDSAHAHTEADMALHTDHWVQLMHTLGAHAQHCTPVWCAQAMTSVLFDMLAMCAAAACVAPEPCDAPAVGAARTAPAYDASLAVSGAIVTPTTAALMLCRRYNHEFVDGVRPALRLLLDGDVPPASLMILYLSAVLDERTTPHTRVVRLCDGCYHVKVALDVPLSNLIRQGVWGVGQRVAVCGAKLLVHTDGVALEECVDRLVVLSVNYNCVRAVAAETRLGLCAMEPAALPIGMVHPQGGLVPALQGVVVRVLPPFFVTQTHTTAAAPRALSGGANWPMGSRHPAALVPADSTRVPSMPTRALVRRVVRNAYAQKRCDKQELYRLTELPAPAPPNISTPNHTSSSGESSDIPRSSHSRDSSPDSYTVSRVQTLLLRQDGSEALIQQWQRVHITPAADRTTAPSRRASGPNSSDDHDHDHNSSSSSSYAAGRESLLAEERCAGLAACLDEAEYDESSDALPPEGSVVVVYALQPSRSQHATAPFVHAKLFYASTSLHLTQLSSSPRGGGSSAHPAAAAAAPHRRSVTTSFALATALSSGSVCDWVGVFLDWCQTSQGTFLLFRMPAEETRYAILHVPLPDSSRVISLPIPAAAGTALLLQNTTFVSHEDPTAGSDCARVMANEYTRAILRPSQPYLRELVDAASAATAPLTHAGRDDARCRSRTRAICDALREVVQSAESAALPPMRTRATAQTAPASVATATPVSGPHTGAAAAMTRARSDPCAGPPFQLGIPRVSPHHHRRTLARPDGPGGGVPRPEGRAERMQPPPRAAVPRRGHPDDDDERSSSSSSSSSSSRTDDACRGESGLALPEADGGSRVPLYHLYGNITGMRLFRRSVTEESSTRAGEEGGVPASRVGRSHGDDVAGLGATDSLDGVPDELRDGGALRGGSYAADAGTVSYDLMKGEMPPAVDAAVTEYFELTWQYGPSCGDVRRARLTQPRVLHDMLAHLTSWSTLSGVMMATGKETERVLLPLPSLSCADTAVGTDDAGEAPCRSRGKDHVSDGDYDFWRFFTRAAERARTDRGGDLPSDDGRPRCTPAQWTRAVRDVMHLLQSALFKLSVAHDEVSAAHFIAPNCCVKDLF